MLFFKDSHSCKEFSPLVVLMMDNDVMNLVDLIYIFTQVQQNNCVQHQCTIPQEIWHKLG